MRLILAIAVFFLLPGNKFADQEKSAIDTKILFTDQFLPHETGPHGVDPSQAWAIRPMVLQGLTLPYIEDGEVYNFVNQANKAPLNPEYFKAITGWGHVYVAHEGNTASNTRVQLRNMRVYIKNGTEGNWKKVKDSDKDGLEGALYDENWATNSSIMANVKNDNGRVSVNMSDTIDYVYHFWPGNGRVTVNPKKVGGLAVSVDARLIVDNNSLVDDRDSARFIVNVGADWWLNKDAPYTKAWGNNAEIGFGRFKYVKREWQTYTMLALWPAGYEVKRKDEATVQNIVLPE